MTAKLKRQAKPNPNDFRLRTLSMDPYMVKDSSFVALSHCWRVCDSQIKKRQAKPNPNDFQLRALSMDPSMVNDSSFVALSHWWRVCGSQIRKKDRLNLTLMTFD